MTFRRLLVASTLAAGIGVWAGCGGGHQAQPTTSSSAPAPRMRALPVPTYPTAAFVFDDDGRLKPSVRHTPRGTQVRLTLISADGRTHAVTLVTPTGRKRLLVPADDRADELLSDLEPGARYRLVPDQDTEPVVLADG